MTQSGTKEALTLVRDDTTVGAARPLVPNPNENPISAGKVREACCASLQELSDKLRTGIDKFLTDKDFLVNPTYRFLDTAGQVTFRFDLKEFITDPKEGYVVIPRIVKENLEVYYNTLGWGTTFSDNGMEDLFWLKVGPIKKDLK